MPDLKAGLGSSAEHPPVDEFFLEGGKERLGRGPLHVAHLGEWCPDAMPYLALPPGWRFLLAPDHEEIWFDPSLLEI